jgi:hypothetical protein
VSNKRTGNNKNHNNQAATSMPTEQMSAEKFYYKELTSDQVTALHQER